MSQYHDSHPSLASSSYLTRRLLTSMNLAVSYSSDEEENLAAAAKDAFALSALPVAKKVRVEKVASGSADAAPHVLSEVSHF